MQIGLAEIQKLVTRSEDIRENLSSEFTEMANTLNEICDNVASSELTESNKNLTASIIEISNTVNKNLPVIIEFLENQIRSYESINTTTKSQIDSLISAIDSIQ